MTTPKDLFTRVLRPVRPEPAAPPALPAPVTRDRVVQHELHDDGSVTIREFVGGEQTERTLTAQQAREELAAPAELAAAQLEGTRIAAELANR